MDWLNQCIAPALRGGDLAAEFSQLDLVRTEVAAAYGEVRRAQQAEWVSDAAQRYRGELDGVLAGLRQWAWRCNELEHALGRLQVARSAVAV